MSIARHVQGSIRDSGLLEPGAGVLAMLSGGADSVCLVHALRELIGTAGMACVHVNHGLREGAVRDERFCVELCEQLGLELDVERVEVADRGNLEARARDARYEAAERVRERRLLDRIATGHTSTDQVETVVYRLVSSPGRRALLGMSRRGGRLIRPLLDVTREQTRQYCEELGLGWREDETNLDLSFARNRLRLEVLPHLREIHPAAEGNVLATADQLREEAEVLDRIVGEIAGQIGAGGSAPSVDAERLRELEPALRRLVLRRLAEEAAGGPIPLRAGQVKEIEDLAARGGSAALDLGGGVRVVSEYGLLRFRRDEDRRAPSSAVLPVPGHCRFGDWDLLCELTPGDEAHQQLGSTDEPVLDAAKLARKLTVRGWRDGDRMRPLGLRGSKSLQDLFTDAKVPRSLRHRLPVVESEGEIAWIAGVALSDLFKVTTATTRAARLKTRYVAAPPTLPSL
jgi:tRNA(Ile)-lysidine synthase